MRGSVSRWIDADPKAVWSVVSDVTRITESFALPNAGFSRACRAVFGKLRGKTNERGRLQTLERVKAIVEA